MENPFQHKAGFQDLYNPHILVPSLKSYKCNIRYL